MIQDSPNWPLAYLITFRTYGTWLHGDERGSVDLTHNIPLTAPLPPNAAREQSALGRMTRRAVNLNRAQRDCVAGAISETTAFRTWSLSAVNVRVNHVHAVVSAPLEGKTIVNILKSWSTRVLREGELWGEDQSPWAKGGSTRCLWDVRSLERACEYVLEAQDGERFGTGRHPDAGPD